MGGGAAGRVPNTLLPAACCWLPPCTLCYHNYRWVGELEEVHAVVRGELELIKKLGKEWFTTPTPGVPQEQLLRFSLKAGE